ncbi:MAG: hypothetical protein MUE79_02430 [Nitratireductor sp.]|nr:hypothetical protein [Nitratireductor sp.]
MSRQFRYSAPKFRTTLLVASGLTVMVAGLAWMMLVAFGNAHPRLWTGVAALVFFGFVSAGMLVRYLRNEPVLAVYPTGLFYARHSSEPLSWETIREIVLRQRETEYELDVYLWKTQQASARQADRPDFTIELSILDAEPMEILEALSGHARLRAETGILPAFNN